MAQELIIQVYDNIASGALPIEIIETEISESPIFVEVQEDYAPVQSVNGKIGWVTIDKSDVGLSNVENVSITGVSGYFQNNINSLSGYANTNYVTKVNGQFVNRPTVNGTGILLSGEAAQLPNSIVYSSGNSQPTDLLIKYITGIQTGITFYDGIFPSIYFTEKPVLFTSLSYEGAGAIVIDGSPGKNRYIIDLTYSNQTGFGINFSSQILETGINLNVLAYGKGVNL
jgi:hypothetical protein